MFRSHHSLAVALGFGAVLLSGCSAVTSTTNVVADAARTVSHGISAASRASTDASVTEPDTPRHASARAYVTSQLAMLRVEAAAGGGEHTDALARLLDQDDEAAFGRWLQAHYGQLFGRIDNARVLVDRIVSMRG